MSPDQRSPFRRVLSGTFAFGFGVSALVLLFAAWLNVTLGDTAAIEASITEAASSERVAEPVLDAATEAIAEQTPIAESQIRSALESVWASPEADDLRQSLASSFIAVATSEPDQSIDLTESVVPLLQRAATELTDAGVAGFDANFDEVAEELGVTVVEVQAEEVPFVGALSTAEQALSTLIAAAALAAAVCALLAYLAAVDRMQRMRRLCATVGLAALFVAGIMWVIAYFAEGALPDEAIGRATGSLLSSNLGMLLVIAAIAIAAALAFRPFQPMLPEAPPDPYDRATAPIPEPVGADSR